MGGGSTVSGGMMGGGGLLLMTLNTLLVVAIVMAAVYVAYRVVQRRDDRPRSKAEQLLAERYVRGEIDRAEFEERRATLREV
jgi:uncharacterized membrane protein